MKRTLQIALVASLTLLCSTEFSYAQKVVVVQKGPRRNVVRRTPNGTVVVHRSRFRPAVVSVFHPMWGPRHSFYHRWVFFPRYNLYWDNWRNLYFYRNANVWVYSAQKPAVVVNVNLENEKHYELPEANDENDAVYDSNQEHVQAYPAQ